MNGINKELVASVDEIFKQTGDYDLESAIELFSSPRLHQKKEDKENRAKAWNSFVSEIRGRQKTIYETGVLTKGTRNSLVETLQGASYDWLDEESGLLVPVVDICITGYQAFRLNDLGSPYSRNEPLSVGPTDIRGVECEVIARHKEGDMRTVSDIGIGLVMTEANASEIFKGDEQYVFVSADRLVSSPISYRSTSTR